MDLLKKAKDRTQQAVSEAVGAAAKTEYDEATKDALARADVLRRDWQLVLACLEAYARPDAAAALMHSLGVKDDGKTKADALAVHLEKAAEQTAQAESQLKDTLNKAAAAYKTIGESTKSTVTAMETTAVDPIKQFIKQDLAAVEKEHKAMETSRLDLDTQKNKKTPDATKLAQAEETYAGHQKKVQEAVANAEAKVAENRDFVARFVKADLEHHQRCAQALQAIA